MKKPLVSIIIPLYNQGTYVCEAIQSVLDQTYQENEIIIVDDGSTDNGREIVESFNGEVRYIWQENKGLAGARNTGIRNASGEILGFLDADDIWLPQYLETMILLANFHADAILFYCCAKSMDENGKDLPEVFGGPPKAPEKIYKSLLKSNFIIPSTILLRRSAVEVMGLFDQNLRSCEDWDLWLRLLPNYKFIGIPDCLVRYRLHTNSLTANSAGMQQAKRAVIEKHFGPEDGQSKDWSWEKRQAYGGFYRYCMLTSVHRSGDWQVASDYLRKALQIDPTLSTDIDLFYDLAHGNQPPGYRGTSCQLNLETNAEYINDMLAAVFNSSGESGLNDLRRKTHGIANFSIGLLAYNIGRIHLGRRHLFEALGFYPSLVGNTRFLSTFSKSLLGKNNLNRLRNFRAVIHKKY